MYKNVSIWFPSSEEIAACRNLSLSDLLRGYAKIPPPPHLPLSRMPIEITREEAAARRKFVVCRKRDLDPRRLIRRPFLRGTGGGSAFYAAVLYDGAAEQPQRFLFGCDPQSSGLLSNSIWVLRRMSYLPLRSSRVSRSEGLPVFSRQCRTVTKKEGIIRLSALSRKPRSSALIMSAPLWGPIHSQSFALILSFVSARSDLKKKTARKFNHQSTCRCLQFLNCDYRSLCPFG